MLVPDMEVGRLPLINSWNNATTKVRKFSRSYPILPYNGSYVSYMPLLNHLRMNVQPHSFLSGIIQREYIACAGIKLESSELGALV